MGSFYAGVLPWDGSPSVEHSVAIAMEPHRYDDRELPSRGWWKWYRIEHIPSDSTEPHQLPKLFGFIDLAGDWHCRLHLEELAEDGEMGRWINETEWNEEILDYAPGGSTEMVIVYCKD